MNQEKKQLNEFDDPHLIPYRAPNAFPRFLRLIWTILILFCVAYLFRYMWPDLVIWLGKKPS